MKKLAVTALLFGTLAIAGCKQGLHDHCQVLDDCSDPYVCSQTTGTCEMPGGEGFDAEAPDSPPVIIDAPPVDAPPDAPTTDAPLVDAMIDAQ